MAAARNGGALGWNGKQARSGSAGGTAVNATLGFLIAFLAIIVLVVWLELCNVENRVTELERREHN
jgi:hypothetical protein